MQFPEVNLRCSTPSLTQFPEASWVHTFQQISVWSGSTGRSLIKAGKSFSSGLNQPEVIVMVWRNSSNTLFLLLFIYLISTTSKIMYFVKLCLIHPVVEIAFFLYFWNKSWFAKANISYHLYMLNTELIIFSYFA